MIQSDLFVPYPRMSFSHHQSQHKTSCLSLSMAAPFTWGLFSIPTTNVLQMFAGITKRKKERVELGEGHKQSVSILRA